MTLIEQLCLIAVIAVLETSLLVGRVWCFASGLGFALIPFVLIAAAIAVAEAKDRRAVRDRLPVARAMRRAS